MKHQGRDHKGIMIVNRRRVVVPYTVQFVEAVQLESFLNHLAEIVHQPGFKAYWEKREAEDRSKQ